MEGDFPKATQLTCAGAEVQLLTGRLLTPALRACYTDCLLASKVTLELYFKSYG